MKLKTLIISVAFSLTSTITFAGQSTDIPVEIDHEIMRAQGNMKTARYDENESAQLGCGTRTFAFEDGTSYRWGFCQASIDDIPENRAFCSTENPELLSEIDSLTNNDFVTFRWDADGICSAVGNSTQSQYLAANKDEAKKVKKDNKNKE
ncbi:hypothetical protein [Aliikangiella sp. IMCC44632]